MVMQTVQKDTEPQGSITEPISSFKSFEEESDHWEANFNDQEEKDVSEID